MNGFNLSDKQCQGILNYVCILELSENQMLMNAELAMEVVNSCVPILMEAFTVLVLEDIT